jgi:hypothetical protein
VRQASARKRGLNASLGVYASPPLPARARQVPFGVHSAISGLVNCVGHVIGWLFSFLECMGMRFGSAFRVGRAPVRGATTSPGWLRSISRPVVSKWCGTCYFLASPGLSGPVLSGFLSTGGVEQELGAYGVLRRFDDCSCRISGEK